MGEVDSDVEGDEWIFYRDRPNWKDVEPVEQDDGPDPVVAIAYSDRFKDVFDYFRAVMRSEEKSSRVFELTTDAVNLNPGNYTVWHYRRLILKELKMDLMEELAFSREMIEDNPKNYQVWNHRRLLVEWLEDAKSELRLVEIILAKDAKNYHAWQHRQWVLKTFKLWEQELEFVEQLLEEDIRNNSAWNQRHFVVVNTTGFTPDVLAREVEFAKNAIKKVVHNESPWNYLRAILSQQLDQKESPMFKYPGIQEFVSELKNREREKQLSGPDRYVHLLSFSLDLIENELEHRKWDLPDEAEKRDLASRASSICISLATEVDLIRKNYWNYVARRLALKYGPLVGEGATGTVVGDRDMEAGDGLTDGATVIEQDAT